MFWDLDNMNKIEEATKMIVEENKRLTAKLKEYEDKMETKEQILNKIKELQAIADNMPDEQREFWKPENNEEYCALQIPDGYCHKTVHEDYSPFSNSMIKLGLYAKNEEGLKEKQDFLETHQQLKEIAHKLNEGRIIDWKNRNQNKYCLIYNNLVHQIVINVSALIPNAFVVYCLSPKFMATAIKEIGEEKLIKYFKNGF